MEERSTSWLRGCYENFAKETKVVNCTNVFLLPSRRDETRIPELHSSHGLQCMCVDVEMWYFYLCFFVFFLLTIATFSFSLFAQKAKLVVLLQHLENESILYL